MQSAKIKLEQNVNVSTNKQTTYQNDKMSISLSQYKSPFLIAAINLDSHY